jgi:4-amino-4-deoxy-L-arabinose transferase-like glycosyltransferase
MAEVTENPPLASYYASLAGSVAGWSERALHLAFLVPAVIVVLATFRLSQRFTDSPLLAALGALLTPGFMVSALSVMCDVTMLAMWMLAAVFWIEGEDDDKPTYLVISGFLIGVAALTKYFGIALIPLLLVYSIIKKRRASARFLLLLIPIALLAMYQVWTASLYGQGSLSRAASFAQAQRESFQISPLASALVAASFTGGCALTVLFLSLSLWSKKFLVVCGTLSVGASALILSGGGAWASKWGVCLR